MIDEELKNQGLNYISEAHRSLSGMSAKALQNMDNLIGNQILNISNNKLANIGGDQSEMDEDEDNLLKKRYFNFEGLIKFCIVRV